MDKANGSPGWTRTNDQRINSPTLYQLSYRGVDEAFFSETLGWALKRRREFSGSAAAASRT
jgi:hypothetical protein